MITVDLDGTLASSLPSALRVWVEKGGNSVRPEEITGYDLTKFLRKQNGESATIGEIVSLFKETWSEPDRISVKHGNARGILDGALGGSWHIRVFTSTVGRPEDVLTFLEHNRLFFDDLEMVSGEREKITAAGQVHLDDNKVTAQAIAELGKYSFLLDTTYAGGFEKLDDRLFLVSDWPHFGRMVLSGAYLQNLTDVPGFEGVKVT
jgi:hypothetical protein